MESYKQIRNDILDCTKCDLSIFAKPVPGFGNIDALLMLVGEAPGYHENKNGYPFVGWSGKHLNKYLDAFKIKRKDIFITNAVKCQPKFNRNPLTSEIKACKYHLINELKSVKPLIIVLMGRIAHKAVFGSEVSIKSVRFKWTKVGNAHIMTTYHPSFLLRNDPDGKPEIALKDFQMIRNKMKQLNPYL